jgi:prepilin-type N-terminal cleavage/methylation domain-containing protein
MIKPARCIVHAVSEKNLSNMKINISRKSGFTLVEIMIVVAIIGLLAAIAIPNFIKARTSAQANACINNLRQIDGAKQQWALDMKTAPTASPAGTDIQPYLGRGTNGTLPYCPADSSKGYATSYTTGNLQTPPVCLILPATHFLN